MVRTQIQLTESQARKLKDRARQHGVSIAELIRRCVEAGLAETPGRGELYARAGRVIGRFPDAKGARDVSAADDRYLDEAFR